MNASANGQSESDIRKETTGTAVFRRFFRNRKRVLLSVAVLVITIFGAWLRLTHFSDRLHIELDQARDVALVSDAVIYGPADLPLLGPKASGTTLRLGPAFYYLQYLSALVFGNTPEGQVLFVAILSALSVPLSFFLFRKLFDDWISVGLSTLYAGSAFFVLYGRFGWNPNPLPFFLFVGALALIRATDGSSRHPGRWFVLSAGSFAVVTQLHFLSFVMAPMLVLAFLVVRRPRFSWKAWFGVVILVTLTYAPVIANEWVTGGANTKAFFVAVGKKKSDHPMAENLVSNVVNQSESYMMLITGNDHIFLPNYALKESGWKRNCGDHCKSTGKALSRTTFWFFAVGSIWLLVSAVRRRSVPTTLLALWYLSAFVVLAMVSDNFAPRFFLLVAPFPFIMLGLPARLLGRSYRRTAHVLFFAIIAWLLFLNGRVIAERFDEADRAGTEQVKTNADHILGEPVRTTLSQERSIVDFFAAAHQENGFPVAIDGEAFCLRSIRLLVEEAGLPFVKLDTSNVRAEENIFIVSRADKEGGSLLKPYRDTLETVERREFGTLSVFVLRVREDASLPTDRPRMPRLSDILFGDREHRDTWRNLFFGISSDDVSDGDEEEYYETTDDL